MIFVVLIHVSVGPFYHSRLGSASWWTADLFDSLARPCVPLFLMASGALLLAPRREESVRNFFKKRLMKVVLPFAFWAMVYMMWRKFVLHEPMTPRFVASQLWSGSVYLHLWFIYTILGLYLVTPVLRVLVRHAAPDVWKLFFTLWFVFGSIFPFIQKATGLEFGATPPLVTGYVGYFLLGWYLHHNYPQKTRPASLLLKTLGLIILTAVGTYFLSTKKGSAAEAFFIYLSPNIVLTSFYAFLFFRGYDWNRLFQRAPFLSRLVGILSSASLGIYFVHVLVLELLTERFVSYANLGKGWPALITVPATTLTVLFLSLMVVLAMRKMPVLKLFVP